MAVDSVSSNSSGAGTISFGGLASGLPADMVDQLMKAQQGQLNTYRNDKQKLIDQKGIYSELLGKVTDLSSKVSALRDATSWAPHILSSSNADKVAATGTSAAVAGTHTLHVAQLATNDTFVAATGVSSTDTLAAGANVSFSYNGVVYGTDAETQTPGFSSEDLEGKSLNEVVALINGIHFGSGTQGVSASILNDGSANPPTYRLVLTARESGKNGDDARIIPPSSMTFTDGGALVFENKVPAQNAIFKLDGVDVSSTSNTPSDVLTGVTLQLKATTGATQSDGVVDATGQTPVVISIANDASTVKSNLNGFVDAYNAVVNFVNKNKEGPLAGSTLARTVVSQMRNLLNSRTNKVGAADAGDFLTRSTLAEYGLRTDPKLGTIGFDGTSLDNALQSDYSGLASLFTNTQAQVGVGKNAGLAYRFETLFKGMTNSVSGSFTTQSNGFQSRVSRLDKDIARESSRLDKVRQQLTAKFSNMEQMVSKLNSAGSAMNSALSKMK
ncbi:MAG: flagellar filament capping protein FliD [Magnetococcus sp. MYC-9]